MSRFLLISDTDRELHTLFDPRSVLSILRNRDGYPLEQLEQEAEAGNVLLLASNLERPAIIHLYVDVLPDPASIPGEAVERRQQSLHLPNGRLIACGGEYLVDHGLDPPISAENFHVAVEDRGSEVQLPPGSYEAELLDFDWSGPRQAEYESQLEQHAGEKSLAIQTGMERLRFLCQVSTIVGIMIFFIGALSGGHVTLNLVNNRFFAIAALLCCGPWLLIEIASSLSGYAAIKGRVAVAEKQIPDAILILRSTGLRV